MKKTIKAYKDESEISHLFQNRTIAYYTLAKISKIGENPVLDRIKEISFDDLKLKVDTKEIVEASIKDDELYYHASILVTSNWNKNDDIFTPETIWAARNTPVHKPTNIQHDSTKIVGHMTSAWAIDPDGNILPENTEELPSKFHILVGSVIYKLYPGNEEYTTNAANLIKEIEGGNLFVSMECSFEGFDYALAKDNEVKIIQRNESTAFLSKYLKAYGGIGEFKDYKLGRILKDISFCGKGYVDKPANAESIILTKDDIFDFAKAEIIQKNEFLSTFGVLNNGEHKTSKESLIMSEFYQEQNKKLEDQNLSLVKQNDELKEKFTKSHAEGQEKEIAGLKVENADMQKVLDTQKKEISDKTTEASDLQKKIDELTKSNEELTKSKSELTDKLSKIEDERKTQSRLSTFIEGGLSKEEAEKEVAAFAKLDDEQFKIVADRIVEAVKYKKEDKKEDKDKKDVKAEDLVDTAKVTDEEVTSASLEDGGDEDETFNSLVKNFTTALKVGSNDK